MGSYRALPAENKLASTRWALILLGPEKPKQLCVAVGFTDILRSAQIWLISQFRMVIGFWIGLWLAGAKRDNAIP